MEKAPPRPVEKAVSRRSNDPFPVKLYKLLKEADANDLNNVVSFGPSGKSFGVHDRKRFMKEIAPKYFRGIKYASFKRQLYTYDFQIVQEGPETGYFFHDLFVKDKPELLDEMHPCKMGHVERKLMEQQGGGSDE